MKFPSKTTDSKFLLCFNFQMISNGSCLIFYEIFNTLMEKKKKIYKLFTSNDLSINLEIGSLLLNSIHFFSFFVFQVFVAWLDFSRMKRVLPESHAIGMKRNCFRKWMSQYNNS